MEWLVHTLRQYPESAIFLTLGPGYFIGKKKFGTFSLGAVTGTLLAGVVIGQLNITISPNVKSIFSLLFLFAMGYGVGPQFFRGLKSDGLPQVLFAALLCLACLFSTYLAAMVLGFGVGWASITLLPFVVGIFAGKYLFKMHPAIVLGACAGARTTTAALGAIQDAAQSKVPALGYTVTYAVGNTLLTIWGVVIVIMMG